MEPVNAIRYAGQVLLIRSGIVGLTQQRPRIAKHRKVISKSLLYQRQRNVAVFGQQNRDIKARAVIEPNNVLGALRCAAENQLGVVSGPALCQDLDFGFGGSSGMVVFLGGDMVLYVAYVFGAYVTYVLFC